jgi:hypothetical protein
MPGHSVSGAHAFCAAWDDVSDHSQPSVSLPLLKHLALPVAFEPPPSIALRSPTIRPSPPPALARASVALNLRHCVFLI